jgi:hypothetical protein
MNKIDIFSRGSLFFLAFFYSHKTNEMGDLRILMPEEISQIQDPFSLTVILLLRFNGRAICFSPCADVMASGPIAIYRQRRNTVMVRAPKRFLDQVLWLEFSELDQARCKPIFIK